MFGNRLRVHRKVLRRVMAFCCTATGTAEDLAAVTPEAVFAFLEGCRSHTDNGNQQLTGNRTRLYDTMSVKWHR